MVEVTKALMAGGLDETGAATLVAKTAINFKVAALIDSVSEDKTIPDAGKERFLTAIAQKYRQDPDVVGKLNDDLGKDPAAAKRLQDMIRTNPDGVASKVIPAYSGGNLSQALSTSTPQRSAATGVSKSEPTAPKHEPVRVAAAPPAPPAPTRTTPVHDAPMSVQDKELFKNAFSLMTNESDETLSGAINRDFVKKMAPAIADEAVSKYGVSQVDADAFAKKIQGDRKLQGEIAENLKNHPDFLRQMAKSMNQEGDVPDGMKEMAKKEMTKIMENPQLLADDKYITDTTSMMKKGSMFSGISGFLKNTLGIDMSGMMGGMGGFFQGIMQWFQDFIGAFTGGAVKDFLSMPSNRNLGMLDKLSVGMGFAMQHASNTQHSPYQMAAMEVLPTAKGDGFFHEEKHTVKGQDGQERTITKTVPNTIEITGANGEKHKVIPTGTAMEVTQLPSGNMSLRLATDAERIQGGGSRVTKTGEFVVKPEEYNRLQAELALKGGSNEFAERQAGHEYDSVKAKPSQVIVHNVDANTGYVEQPRPVGQTPATAQQDLDTMKKATLDQTALQVVPGFLGGA